MIRINTALLLIGSPKRSRSTSESLGNCFIEKLQNRNISAETMNVWVAIQSEEGIKDLLNAITQVDLVILSFPLYVDSLPSSVTKALEIIEQHYNLDKSLKKPGLIAIANNGFPESKQNEVAISICRLFAKETGFKWLGGLATGMGGMINGRPLKQLNRRGKNAVKALELAAEAISKGEEIPATAVELMGKASIPFWLYLLISTRNRKKSAKKNNIHEQIYATPYLNHG
ncbi:MAG: hypothetical protein ACFFD4_17995 [Candidatus Odinarchaeota archaeon]